MTWTFNRPFRKSYTKEIYQVKGKTYTHTISKENKYTYSGPSWFKEVK